MKFSRFLSPFTVADTLSYISGVYVKNFMPLFITAFIISLPLMFIQFILNGKPIWIMVFGLFISSYYESLLILYISEKLLERKKSITDHIAKAFKYSIFILFQKIAFLIPLIILLVLFYFQLSENHFFPEIIKDNSLYITICIGLFILTIFSLSSSFIVIEKSETCRSLIQSYKLIKPKRFKIFFIIIFSVLSYIVLFFMTYLLFDSYAVFVLPFMHLAFYIFIQLSSFFIYLSMKITYENYQMSDFEIRFQDIDKDEDEDEDKMKMLNF